MSKFKGLFEARQQHPVDPFEDSDTQNAETPKRRGRPRAMRSDPNFLQVTAYIRKTTHQQIKIELLREGKGTNFSELVEQLLEQWLKARPAE